MKSKKPGMKKLKMMIRKLHEDPELMEIAKKFVAHLGSRA